MQSVNHFNVKKKAHRFSRRSDDASTSWNPFRLVSWDKKPVQDSARQLEEGQAGALQPDLIAAEKETQAGPATIRRNSSGMEAADELHDGERGGGVTQGTTFESQQSQLSTHPLVPNGKGKNLEGLRNRKSDLATVPSGGDDDNGKKKDRKKSGFIRHVQPKQPFTVANQLQRTLLNSWINILFLAAPVGIALNYVESVDRVVIFCINFIAIVPGAAMLGFATEEIALRTGEAIGGLLNATFGNAVELIVAIMALADGEVIIVQTSLIGSVLSNLLLVLGMCFFLGGLRRVEQHFNETVAQTAASLLALAVASVIVPTVFKLNNNDTQETKEQIAALSRGTSIILLIVYAAYLFFQLKSHKSVFQEESQKNPSKPWSRGGLEAGAVQKGLAMPGGMMARNVQGDTERLSQLLLHPPHLAGGVDDEEEEEEPQLHFWVAILTLGVSTAVIALCAEFMVDSIHSVTEPRTEGGKAPLSKEFVGLILLPIVGNAAEHATAVTVAIKDKMDLAIGVAVGSSMQVSLFLIPLLVIIGWGMGNDDMTLSFDTFQVAVLFVSVLLANYLIGDGKSHWLEGWQLICLYFIIAVCAFCKFEILTTSLT